MQLRDLLYQTKVIGRHGDDAVEVRALELDSRSVSEGSCFIAIKGSQADGHTFIAKAIEQGAASVVCEAMPENLDENVTYVQVRDSAEALGQMSHLFYGEPSRSLKIIGVTGTNGKTTVATLLYNLFTELGYKCGLISTVRNIIGTEVIESTHTTPDAIRLNELLGKMVDAGCTHVFMECSSHAIQQKRLQSIEFAGAIFTNITHDHLDYHGTFDEYIRVKKSWFDNLPTSAFALSNADDKRGMVMLQNTRASKKYYSLRTPVDFKGKILNNGLDGLHMQINNADVHFRLIGEFNAYNLLAVYGAAVLCGEDPEAVLLKLSNLDGAEGRFDTVMSPNEKIMAVVDYAHTPDALLNVLATIKNLRSGNEQVITMVGCGGNRDAAKRPLMAKVATEYSDKVIFTSDNPRNEDPALILQDMEAGVDAAQRRKCITIADRREAIKTAVNLAQPKDIILIAGKGHEKYQEIKGVKHPFDDKQILISTYQLLGK